MLRVVSKQGMPMVFRGDGVYVNFILFDMTQLQVVCDDSGVHSTEDIPVTHKPKDECGGGR
jgi:hypothetical protein